jgi:diguanylate cyclase (GGDEF)-like protein/PAS domain S-box-containing protein
MAQHILLVQDDDAAAVVVNGILRRVGTFAFQVDWVRDCAAAVRRLAAHRDRRQHQSIAAIIVDLSALDSGGPDALERFRTAAPRTPILVLCSASEEQTAKLALGRGAQDYLVKERIDDYSLPKALNGMIGRAAKDTALREQSDHTQDTLDSIGDAVISTDVDCRVTYLNAVAEHLTGWSRADAEGRPLEDVFCVIDAATRTVADNPMAAAIQRNKTVGLTPNCILLARDGLESAVEDSAAPIRDHNGDVTGAVLVFRDVSTARAHAQRMSHLAQHDSLTNLPNRVLLKDRLTQALSLADRQRHKVSVLFVDVDRFKPINDELGHEVGDRLLQLVAERLMSSVRASDTVSRVGGDEFVVVLPQLEHAQAAAISAEKILRAVRGPYGIGSHELQVTASVGIATYPDDGADATTLIRHADRAMYAVKEMGRNNYGFVTPASDGRDLRDTAAEAVEARDSDLGAALSFATACSQPAG